MNDAVEPRLWVFAAWAVAGVGLSLSAVTPFTIGIYLFPATAVAIVALLVWPGGRVTAFQS